MKKTPKDLTYKRDLLKKTNEFIDALHDDLDNIDMYELSRVLRDHEYYLSWELDAEDRSDDCRG